MTFPTYLRNRYLIIHGIGLVCLAATAHAASSFHGIGTLPNSGGPRGSTATGISADGRFVVGLSATIADHNDGSNAGNVVRWSIDGGLEDYGVAAHGGIAPVAGPHISQDGSWIGGSLFNPFVFGFRHSDDGVFQPIPNAWLVNDISGDGNTLVGTRFGFAGSGRDRAGRYREANGFAFEDLGFGTQDENSFSSAISESGNAIAGFVEQSAGIVDVYRFREGFGSELLFTLTDGNGPSGYVAGIANEGDTIIGRDFRWTANGGLEDLRNFMEPFAVADNGSVLVGRWNNQAVMMNDSGQVESIQDVLINDFGLDLSGWSLRAALDISPDGSVIVGWGIHNGTREGWVAYIPEPSGLIVLAFAPIAIIIRRRNE